MVTYLRPRHETLKCESTYKGGVGEGEGIVLCFAANLYVVIKENDVSVSECHAHRKLVVICQLILL